MALIHTIFNLLTTALLMPFSARLVKLTERLVHDRPGASGAGQEDVLVLDDLLLRSPSVAVAESFNVSKRMCAQAWLILQDAMSLFRRYDPEVAQRVLDAEDALDRYEDKLSTYLVKLSAQALSSQDSQITAKILHAIGDFERLGDHAVNLYKVAKELHDKNVRFSPAAEAEVKVLSDALEEILLLTTQAYESSDVSLAAKVEPLEQVIDRLTAEIKDNHIRRLQRGTCTIEGGFILSDLLNNYERISDHCSNIAVAIIEVEHNSFDTHEYLNGIKYGNSSFNELYDQYNRKYAL